jgi:TrmH family RNA methyltransferase
MTNIMTHNPLDAITVVLHRPQEAVNVGAIVRAMKNMGISDLKLVQPEAFTSTDILRLAHRCEDILAQMTIHQDLDTALAEMVYVVGTAAITHHKRPLTQDIRGLAHELITRTSQGRIALLFGQEDDGLDNQAIDRCHLIAMLPTNPAYPALNLAQSVLLILHEIRMAALVPEAIATELAVEVPAATIAEQTTLEQLFQLSEEALTAIDFFRYNPAVVMRTLRQIAYRATLTQEEAGLLMAITRKIIKSARPGSG